MISKRHIRPPLSCHPFFPSVRKSTGVSKSSATKPGFPDGGNMSFSDYNFSGFARAGV